MTKKRRRGVFDTDERIRLGIWGLGRGMSFYDTCRALNVDVVAGCDYSDHMREHFAQANPGTMVTADAAEFLDGDFDAVLLATYCPGHADDAIACLDAGKHVVSEVTAFHTMAEGVRLVEAVERSGLVYNLAENYGYTAPHMYLARTWREGVFGDLMYAEGEYVHEVRSLAYTHIDGVPITPGDTLHNWRSWLHFHYYCTHSLGPIMFITGTRPTRVVSLPGGHCLPGFPMPKVQGLGGIAPSLVNMSNGAVVRNLMGGTTNDAHLFRYWGTKGAAEASGETVHLRLGGGGSSPKLKLTPDWGELTDIAGQTGHGGGDFWVMYYFARQLLFGTAAPFGIHEAADVTIPGILAYRSSRKGGTPYDVPDFRKKKDRDKHRGDDEGQLPRRPRMTCFPRNADKAITGRFTSVMAGLVRYSEIYRAYADWIPVADRVDEPSRIVAMADTVIKEYPAMAETMKEARAIADAYPRSEGARLLREMLGLTDEEHVLRPGFLAQVRKDRNCLKRRRR